MNALLRILAWTFAVALVVLPVVAVLNGWIAAERWPLRTLRVQDVVEMYNESKVLFASSGHDVRALRLDPRGSWSLVLSDGAEVIVGRSDARPRIGRFARLLPQLLATPQRTLRRADLRYTNGFALQWADAPPVAAPAGTSQGNT